MSKALLAFLILSDVSHRLAELSDQFELLDDWVDLIQCIQQCSNCSIKPYVDWVLGRDGTIAHGRMAPAFKRHFYRLWVDQAFARRPRLAGFRGQDHEALVNRFRELDKHWLTLTIAVSCLTPMSTGWKRLPPG